MTKEPPLHLSSHQLPKLGASVWINHPRHDGDTPLHDHDFLELALVTNGHAIHRTIHGEQPVALGDLLVLHPGQWHAYEKCRGLRLYNCCIGPGLLSGELAWIGRDPFLGCIVSPSLFSNARDRPTQGVLTVHLTSDEQRSCVQELEKIRLLQTASTPVQARAEIVAHVLLLLSCIAQRIASTKSVMHAMHGSIPEAVNVTRQAMEERLEYSWGLQELANLSGLTRFSLMRLFRQHCGCPPMVWLMRRRVERAAVLLLTTDLPMAEVGQRVGWSDANYFSRRFRGGFGRSPREYRAQLPLPAVVRKEQDWVQW